MSPDDAYEITLIFFTRQVKQPVLLRVYLGRFLWVVS